MTDSILADIPKDGDTDPFAGLEKETPSESQPEEIKETETPEKTEEKEVPFHEHPRWIAHQKELEELRAFKEEVVPQLEQLRTLKDTPQPTGTVPDWFRELYGDNVEAYKKLQAHEQQTYQEIEQRVLNAQEARKQQELQEISKWNGWVDGEVSRLQSEGKAFEKNELLKVMIDYRPSDDKGNFDFNKGYAIYEALKTKEAQPKSDARKKLGDTASHGGKGEAPKKDFQTTNDLRHKDWTEL